MSALEDEKEDVRENAYEALGKIGGTAARDEMIVKLVSALGDENDNVSESALYAIGKMGKKAATNEVITNLMGMRCKDGTLACQVPDAIDNILSSSTSIMKLDPKLILQLSWRKSELICLKNVLMDELIVKFFDTQSRDWLPLVADIALQKGAALLMTNGAVMVYDKKEPVVVHVSNLELHQELIGVLTNQAIQMHLSFGIESEKITDQNIPNVNNGKRKRGDSLISTSKRQKQPQQDNNTNANTDSSDARNTEKIAKLASGERKVNDLPLIKQLESLQGQCYEAKISRTFETAREQEQDDFIVEDVGAWIDTAKNGVYIAAHIVSLGDAQYHNGREPQPGLVQLDQNQNLMYRQNSSKLFNEIYPSS
ncbi:unnamed protein product [Didymodactylos carnosus]|uniref:HEAT repeat domain-containing protein n=1 Tax=Didymodactylos carnosus TaxID=1234261 RepID=A0A815QUD6_9BILA|nr:unnamed protein product [Didymodactylos carnosus]CAF4336706.1 unnamed protein product [Didymodactylos carnosus]